MPTWEGVSTNEKLKKTCEKDPEEIRVPKLEKKKLGNSKPESKNVGVFLGGGGFGGGSLGGVFFVGWEWTCTAR